MAILTARRRFHRLALVAAVFLTAYLLLRRTSHIPQHEERRRVKYVTGSFDWAARRPTHPVDKATMTRMPPGIPRQLPRIQHEFTQDELSASHNQTQRARRDAVRHAAERSWRTYREHAWGRDEIAPLTLRGQDSFAGWGATAVDSLDTLWIMDMKDEFQHVVRHVATIDWDKPTSKLCSLFETTIRFLGGLLAAYDLSRDRVLLDKAVELGEMLYAGFDTPNHMPANSFNFRAAKEGTLVAGTNEASAAAASLSLEFTRLSQLTGDPKYYHAIDGVTRALEKTQDSTKLPGMWPVFVDLKNDLLTPGHGFSLGASADSAYEYLSKMHALLGGLDPVYEKLHTKAMATATQHLLFRPMLPDSPAPAPDILFSGSVFASGTGEADLNPEVQHLACFAGGMFALGGRLFGDDGDVQTGERLARGCAWAYGAFPTGIMPEVSEVVACQPAGGEAAGGGGGGSNLAACAWDEKRWEQHGKHPKPFTSVRDSSYILRPEAIESVFVLYRITGKADLLDVAWQMFESVRKATETELAHSAIKDVQAAGETVKTDAMEVSYVAASDAIDAPR